MMRVAISTYSLRGAVRVGSSRACGDCKRGARVDCWACVARRELGRESLDDPAPICPAVAQAVVQAAGAPLPELDHVGNDTVAAPVWRARHLPARILGLSLGGTPLQRLTVRNDTALRRGPGPALAAEWATGEVGIRLLHRRALQI